jgi:hypothetical protein
MKFTILLAFAALSVIAQTSTDSIVVNPPRAASIIITAIPGQFSCTITQDNGSADVQWTIAGVSGSVLALPAAALAAPGLNYTVTYGGASISISLTAVTTTPGQSVQWTVQENAPGAQAKTAGGSF